MSNTAPPWKKPALALEASVVADDAPLEVIPPPFVLARATVAAPLTIILPSTAIFVQVVPKLYIGSIYAALNEEGLRRLGITHIVNASRFPPTFPSSFTYLTIDVRDHATANLLR